PAGHVPLRRVSRPAHVLDSAERVRGTLAKRDFVRGAPLARRATRARVTCAVRADCAAPAAPGFKLSQGRRCPHRFRDKAPSSGTGSRKCAPRTAVRGETPTPYTP